MAWPDDRLEHHRVAARQRRRHLVRYQVEREVEGRDGGDHATRLAVVQPKRFSPAGSASISMISPAVRLASSLPSET